MATRRSARLRLDARTRISTSLGFGSGFGTSRISTPFSPTTAAFMLFPRCAGRISVSVIRHFLRGGLRLRLIRLRRCLLQPLGRVERGVDDALVAGAAAQIARDGDPHLAFGGIGIIAQELDQRGEDAGRAEAALQAVIVAERFL